MSASIYLWCYSFTLVWSRNHIFIVFEGLPSQIVLQVDKTLQSYSIVCLYKVWAGRSYCKCYWCEARGCILQLDGWGGSWNASSSLVGFDIHVLNIKVYQRLSRLWYSTIYILNSWKKRFLGKADRRSFRDLPAYLADRSAVIRKSISHLV